MSLLNTNIKDLPKEAPAVAGQHPLRILKLAQKVAKETQRTFLAVTYTVLDDSNAPIFNQNVLGSYDESGTLLDDEVMAVRRARELKSFCDAFGVDAEDSDVEVNAKGSEGFAILDDEFNEHFQRQINIIKRYIVPVTANTPEEQAGKQAPPTKK